MPCSFKRINELSVALVNDNVIITVDKLAIITLSDFQTFHLMRKSNKGGSHYKYFSTLLVLHLYE